MSTAFALTFCIEEEKIKKKMSVFKNSYDAKSGYPYIKIYACLLILKSIKTRFVLIEVFLIWLHFHLNSSSLI